MATMATYDIHILLTPRLAVQQAAIMINDEDTRTTLHDGEKLLGHEGKTILSNWHQYCQLTSNLLWWYRNDNKEFFFE